MSSTRTALVNASNVVVDVVIAGEDYEAPEGLTAYASETAGIGDTRSGKKFARPDAGPASKDELKVHADRLQERLVGAGVLHDVGTAEAPLVVSADTTADGKANLLGILQGYALGILSGTFDWYQSTGKVALTQEQLQALAVAVLGYGSAVFAAWQGAIDGIESGTITTHEKVEAKFAPLRQE